MKDKILNFIFQHIHALFYHLCFILTLSYLHYFNTTMPKIVILVLFLIYLPHLFICEPYKHMLQFHCPNIVFIFKTCFIVLVPCVYSVTVSYEIKFIIIIIIYLILKHQELSDAVFSLTYLPLRLFTNCNSPCC